MFGVLDIAAANDANGEDSQLICTFLAPVATVTERLETASDTISLKRRTSRGVAQRWRVEASGVAGTDTVDYFINNMENGATKVMFVRPPSMVKYATHAVGIKRAVTSEEYPSSTENGIVFSKGTGAVAAGAGVGIGVSTVNMLVDDESQVFKGDFIKFQNHDKIYLVKKISAIVVGSHSATVDLMPPLKAAVAEDEVIHLGKNVAMSCFQDISTIVGMRYMDGILEDLGNLIFVEALS